MLSTASTRAFAAILLALTAWAWLRMQPKVEVPALPPPPKPGAPEKVPGLFPDE
ncbi:MAG: hypothetical protein HS117_04240 [Verrucomicrobiaceae bacterium]|nr:hypothetical protein [Verrucomicrobiaceae bacterium]